jgi:hypothetical protein
MNVQVAITADVQQVDETGFVWTLLAEAGRPEQVLPGRIVVAGDADSPFVARVVDIVERAGHQIVHLEVLGSTDEFVDEFRNANLLADHR